MESFVQGSRSFLFLTIAKNINMSKATFISLLLITALTFQCCKKKDSDVRDIFIGTYSVTETWTENGKVMNKPAFSISVEKASLNINGVLLNNFANYGAGTTVEATISDYLITIPQQTLPNLKAVTGTGHTDGITMTFDYTEKLNSISIAIKATAKRK
jgi:hypothetical protein